MRNSLPCRREKLLTTTDGKAGNLRTELTLFLAVFAGCVEIAAAQMPVTKVVLAEARMIEAPSTIRLVGTVNPFRTSRVGSEIDGLVAEMPARQGDLIQAGDVICRLRDDTRSLLLAEAQANLERFKQRHAELLAGTRPREIARLKALLDETAADLERWKLEMERVSALYAEANSNAKEVYDTRAEFLTAQRRKAAAEARYELALEGERPEVIAQAAYEVDARRALVGRYRYDLEKTAIRAPFTGHVVTRSVEVGEWIRPGDQIVEMVDLSSVLVAVDAPEYALPFVAPGDPARVEVDALNRSYAGTIKHVIRQADASARTFRVEVELDNAEGLLAGGMFARVTIPSGPKQQAVAVPKDATVEKAGIPNVAIVMPGKQGGMTGMLMPVTLGWESGEWIAITSGNVHPGMGIITHGNENLFPFPTPVIVVNERGTPVEMPQGERGDTAHAGHANVADAEHGDRPDQGDGQSVHRGGGD